MARYKAEGLAGLADRSSRPRHQYRPVAPAIAGRVIVLRRQRLTGKHIAKITAVSAATVSRVLKRAGLRAAELPIWTPRYNWHRPHGSLKSNPPISRLGLSEDNLLRLHS